jgi:hypothetical protein
MGIMHPQTEQLFSFNARLRCLFSSLSPCTRATQCTGKPWSQTEAILPATWHAVSRHTVLCAVHHMLVNTRSSDNYNDAQHMH